MEMNIHFTSRDDPRLQQILACREYSSAVRELKSNSTVPNVRRRLAQKRRLPIKSMSADENWPKSVGLGSLGGAGQEATMK